MKMLTYIGGFTAILGLFTYLVVSGLVWAVMAILATVFNATVPYYQANPWSFTFFMWVLIGVVNFLFFKTNEKA